MLNDASDWERCCWERGRPVFVLRELGASEVVLKRLLSVHLCGGQAGLWAVLAELGPTGMVCVLPTALINDN